MAIGRQDRLRHVSCGRRSILPPIRLGTVNVLGKTDSNIGGKNETRLQIGGHWKLPMLILDLVITPEWDTLPIHRRQSGERNGFCMSVGIQGKVSSGA